MMRQTASSTLPTRPPSFDWSVGRYEHTAVQLLPAAEAVVQRAAPLLGERVLDVGCGSGNAALLAAERGTRVTGIDPALRLLEVARTHAARGLQARFQLGEAARLPLADASVDIVLSVFAVILAADAQAAAAELATTAPTGRIVLSAWIPGQRGGQGQPDRAGSGDASTRCPRRPAALSLGPPPRTSAPYGFADKVTELHSLAFTAASADAYLDTRAEQPSARRRRLPDPRAPRRRSGAGARRAQSRQRGTRCRLPRHQPLHRRDATRA